MHSFNPALLLAGAALLAITATATPGTPGYQCRTCSTTGITFVPIDVGVSRLVENDPNAYILDPVHSNFSIAGFVEPALRFSIAAISKLIANNNDAKLLLPNITNLFLAQVEPTGGAGPLPNGSVPVAIAPFPAITTVFSAVPGARTLVPSMSCAVEGYLSAAVALASGVPGSEGLGPLVSQLLLSEQASQLIVLPTATFGNNIPTSLPTIGTCTTPKGIPGHC